MFSGIVAGTGTVSRLERRDGGALLAIGTAVALDDLGVGDSLCVSGACLTAVHVAAGEFHADLSAETLGRTTLGELGPGSTVNLEKALRAGDPLGGHLVTGHVDGIGVLRERRRLGGSEHWRVELPGSLCRYLAEKGSLCLDGVSLTVSAVDATVAGLDLIPHTLAVTTLGGLEPGARLNVEVDLIARYLEGLLLHRDG